MASFRYPSQGLLATAVASSAFPLLAPDGTAAAPSYSFATYPTSGMYMGAANQIYFSSQGTAVARVLTGFFTIRGDMQFAWESTTIASTRDVLLNRNAAGILDLHNTTTGSAQFNVWNTRTSASVGEWLESLWSGNVAIIRTNSAGGGTARTLRINYSGTTVSAINVPSGVNNEMSFINGGTWNTAIANGILSIGRGITQTATSGTTPCLNINFSPAPSSSSTMDWRSLEIGPTINYASGGAGRVQLIRLAPTNTALPTGLNGAMVLASTASALGGIQFHNQTDEVTNYEYAQVGFSSNAFLIKTFAGGTGTLRGFTLECADGGIRINNQTNAAAANVGTLTNSPVTGNPNFWLPVSIAGTTRYIPCF